MESRNLICSVLFFVIFLSACSGGGYNVNLQDKCPQIVDELKLEPICEASPGSKCSSPNSEYDAKIQCYSAMNTQQQCQNACALHCTSLNMAYSDIDRPAGVCHCACK